MPRVSLASLRKDGSLEALTRTRLVRAQRPYGAVESAGYVPVRIRGDFVGFQVIWGVSHALHTPLMAVTNAISGIIIIGALLQIAAGGGLVRVLAAVSVAIATINIVGGFMVTRRMLNMFQKS